MDMNSTIRCLISPIILNEIAAYKAYWKSGKDTIEIRNYKEGAHTEICSVTLKGVKSMNWTFFIVGKHA